MKHSTSYNAKFLGTADVDEATGIDIVKEAVVKIKFSNQLKLSEGQKPAKVQIVISLDGITIVDDKTRDVLHFRPLNAISYCADDKTDKGIFTFIAKYPDSNQHSCFVFESEKLAEEITATIGQTFDLAYQKLVESSSKDASMKKQFVSLQKRVQDLMLENGHLKKRILTLENLVDPTLLDTDNKKRHNSLDTQKSMSLPRQMSPHVKAASLSSSSEENITTHLPYRQSSSPAKIQLTRSPLVTKSVSTSPSTPPLLAPPPPPPRAHHLSVASSSSTDQDIFGSPPFSPSPTTVRGASPTSSSPSPPAVPPRSTFTSDPFGMGIFTPTTLNTKVAPDWSFPVMQSPLLQSTYNPTADFSLTELDPLCCK